MRDTCRDLVRKTTALFFVQQTYAWHIKLHTRSFVYCSCSDLLAFIVVYICQNLLFAISQQMTLSLCAKTGSSTTSEMAVSTSSAKIIHFSAVLPSFPYWSASDWFRIFPRFELSPFFRLQLIACLSRFDFRSQVQGPSPRSDKNNRSEVWSDPEAPQLLSENGHVVLTLQAVWNISCFALIVAQTKN